jgi:hypothetical protein
VSPNAERRLSQLLAARQKGVFSDSEMVNQFGYLAAVADIKELLDRVPPDLVDVLKQGIAGNNRQEADDECLHPEGSPFDYFPSYYQKAATVLFGDRQLGGKRVLSVVCLPSFKVEWALVLLRSAMDEFTLSLSVAEKQIWSSDAEVPVAAKRIEAALSPEIALGVCDVWRMMLRRSRHPESRRLGMDGVNYHFATYGRGIGSMAAKTWSPNPETAPGKLVSLSHLLHQYVVGAADRVALANEVDQAIESLKRHFPPAPCI